MNTTKNNHLVQPYLFFNGSCEQAVDFYRKALGAEVEMMMRFKESPEPPKPGMVPPGFENKIMHTSFRVGQTTIMASDGCSAEKAKFEGFSLSIADAAGEDFLVSALRHVVRPVRYRLDGQRVPCGTEVSARISHPGSVGCSPA